MHIIFDRRSYTIAGGFLGLILLIVVIWNIFHKNSDPDLLTQVERGTVNETISVSGFVEAKNAADLAFPEAGVVTDILVNEGDSVKQGDILVTQGSRKQVAARQEAVANLESSIASLNESVAGPTAETRAVTNTELERAKNNLERTISEQNRIVDNALYDLLSTDLEALPKDPDNEHSAPMISGSYSCTESGKYEINFLSSSEGPGTRNYRLTGIETGNYTAYEDSPTAMGECGLKIQLTDASEYTGDSWIISVPNTRSGYYVDNNNTYELALRNKENTIAEAEQDLDVLSKEALENNSSARSEVIQQKEAGVAQAKAKIDQIDSDLSDRSIVAPFDGSVTDINIVVGETARNNPVITILAEDKFEVTARIPEIDIRKISDGKKVRVKFDAAPDEILEGYIDYIPPQSTEIDGVAYFEANILLNETPDWIRSGFNADIEIIIEEKENVLRLPKRFVQQENNSYYVWQNRKRVMVEVVLVGNDGYLAIENLNEGETVSMPSTEK